MREHKYKAWDKKNRRMVTVWTISWKAWHDDGEINYVEVEYDDGTYKLMEHEIELLEFTGLKDKNGREIYEGDIVEITGHLLTGPLKGRQEVYWYERNDYTKCGFAPFCNLDQSCTPFDVEIIGNIYESPELLTPKDQREEG